MSRNFGTLQKVFYNPLMPWTQVTFLNVGVIACPDLVASGEHAWPGLESVAVFADRRSEVLLKAEFGRLVLNFVKGFGQIESGLVDGFG